MPVLIGGKGLRFCRSDCSRFAVYYLLPNTSVNRSNSARFSGSLIALFTSAFSREVMWKDTEAVSFLRWVG